MAHVSELHEIDPETPCAKCGHDWGSHRHDGGQTCYIIARPAPPGKPFDFYGLCDCSGFQRSEPNRDPLESCGQCGHARNEHAEGGRCEAEAEQSIGLGDTRWLCGCAGFTDWRPKDPAVERRAAWHALPGALDPATEAELVHWFSYHAPVGDQASRYEMLRAAALAYARTICALCPPSADRTAALRKLRECVYTANASIACEGR